ncbi:MAG TPA: hypothetical protein DDW65_15910 [Firmicutes bacterium]|nr:hypothetical protein [Bacillota bacterium]
MSILFIIKSRSVGLQKLNRNFLAPYGLLWLKQHYFFEKEGAFVKLIYAFIKIFSFLMFTK